MHFALLFSFVILTDSFQLRTSKLRLCDIGMTSSRPSSFSSRTAKDITAVTLPLLTSTVCFALFASPVEGKSLLFDTGGKPSILPVSNFIDNTEYKKPLFNLPPTELEFPKTFLGEWDANYVYESAEFTDKVLFTDLQRDVNVAGFRKYSVVYMPDIGKDVSTILRFVDTENNGRVTEDISFNLKSLIERQISDSKCIVKKVVYNPTMNANRIGINYEDTKGRGSIEIFVNNRKSRADDTSFYNLVHQRQSSVRIARDIITDLNGYSQAATQLFCDYAIEYDLKIESAETITGTFRIFSYLQPQDSFYFKSPDLPVAMFQYKIQMLKKV